LAEQDLRRREANPEAEAARQRKREDFKAVRARKRAQDAMQAFNTTMVTPPPNGASSSLANRKATPRMKSMDVVTFDVGGRGPSIAHQASPTPIGKYEEVDC
jgi:hypothetical protein